MRSALSTPAGRLVALRTVVALGSAMVLLATGIGWNLYTELTGGISTTDVITGGLGARKLTGTGQNILLVGVDSRTDAKGRPLPRNVLAELRSGAEDGVLNSDTIILLHVPPDGNRASGISIPRDSYVDIPGMGKDKINTAYPVTKARTASELREEGGDPATIELEAATAGRTTLIKTVEKLTGIKVDHYAEVNLLGFYNLTNAIGGVEVCLKAPVNEFRSGARFPAGVQTISGGAALAFVRQRYELPESDFSRIRRQQVFLASVAGKILSAGTLANPGKLAALVEVAKESVVLDADWDVLAFAQQASDLAGGRLEFVTIPIDGQDSNGSGDVVLVDPVEVRRFVAGRTGQPGSASATTPPSATSEPSAAVAPSRLTVDVRNGSGRSGLASRVAEELADRGYRTGKLDNIAEPISSTVHYPTGQSAAGTQVAQLLGGLATEEDAEIPFGRVRVHLASDFSLSDITRDDRSRSARPSTRRSAPPVPPPPPAPPITAEGVPCVD